MHKICRNVKHNVNKISWIFLFNDFNAELNQEGKKREWYNLHKPRIFIFILDFVAFRLVILFYFSLGVNSLFTNLVK